MGVQTVGCGEVYFKVSMEILYSSAFANIDEGWTPTHAHFLIMGGFTYFNGEIKTVPDFHEFCDLLRTPQISFPTITAEIRDKARGDFLSKAIVILQSISNLLPLSLNGVMYYFWWDKPLAVNEPVTLYRKGHEPAERVIKGTTG